jgi:hypothetical protein
MSNGVTIGTTAARQFLVGKLRGTLSDGPTDDALVAALTASEVGGRIHGYPLPDELPLPAIVFSRYGGGDLSAPLGRAGTGRTAATTILMQVKAICEGYDETPIIEPSSIIDQLLDARSGVVDTGLGTFYVEVTRESELLTDLPPEEDGTIYQQLGGVYSFYVSRVG